MAVPAVGCWPNANAANSRYSRAAGREPVFWSFTLASSRFFTFSFNKGVLLFGSFVPSPSAFIYAAAAALYPPAVS
jgi:hypothetical protein